MRLSQFHLATVKEVPADAEVASHKLMLRAGMIRKLASGLYTWSPLGLRVLRKVEHVVREEMVRAGAIEVLMPSVQPRELWEETGRWEKFGGQLLKIKDRKEQEFCYGPTHEEVITDFARNELKSYKQLPLNFFQIQTKFRDEIRPRFGVMRSREFLMKDAYSFDFDQAGARHAYNRMFVAYLRTFAGLGLKAIPMRADTGPIGGDLSHEFIILAPTGESGVFYDRRFEDQDWLHEPVDIEDPASLAAFFERVTSMYAATDEKHDTAAWSGVEAGLQREGRGIEVGHIFYFGTKYTQSMGITVGGADGAAFHPEMGSYGIGISRLAGAIIEASHDDAGIIWPIAVAPFRAAILNLKAGDAACDAACALLHDAAPDDLLLDDRGDRAGVKFADADLMGHPLQFVVGPRGAAAGTVEVKRRADGERSEMSVGDARTLIGRLR